MHRRNRSLQSPCQQENGPETHCFRPISISIVDHLLKKISISRAASRTPRPQDGPAFIRSRKATGSTGPFGPRRRIVPTTASAAQKPPSAMVKIRSGRSSLAGGASGFGDGGCSVGVCMGSFRFVDSPPPKAPAMPARERAGNDAFPALSVRNFSLFTQLLREEGCIPIPHFTSPDHRIVRAGRNGGSVRHARRR
jgi:hypothetical protein